MYENAIQIAKIQNIKVNKIIYTIYLHSCFGCYKHIPNHKVAITIK